MTNAIDFLTNEAEAEAPEAERPPRMYWHNGSKSKSGDAPGDFYIAADELANDPAAPWEPSSRFSDEPGFATARLRIAPIILREQPYRTEKGVNGAKDIWIWHTGRWQPGMKIYTEIICMVEGINEPVNLIVKGMTGKAFSGKGGVFPQALAFRRDAERIAKKALPLWAFWQSVGTKLDAKGKIVFEDTGYGSVVTPPTLYLPEGDTKVRMNALFIGKDWYNAGFELKAHFAAWSEERRVNDAIELETDEAQPAVAGRNMPQAISDEEILPF